MPIHAPHDHLYNSVKLETAKAKLTHAGRKSLYAPLNLVAYIDMMTMLVIFLLMSFSATGEILFVQKNIVLPDAQNRQHDRRSLSSGLGQTDPRFQHAGQYSRHGRPQSSENQQASGSAGDF